MIGFLHHFAERQTAEENHMLKTRLDACQSENDKLRRANAVLLSDKAALEYANNDQRTLIADLQRAKGEIQMEIGRVQMMARERGFGEHVETPPESAWKPKIQPVVPWPIPKHEQTA